MVFHLGSWASQWNQLISSTRPTHVDMLLVCYSLFSMELFSFLLEGQQLQIQTKGIYSGCMLVTDIQKYIIHLKKNQKITSTANLSNLPIRDIIQSFVR